MTHVLLLLYSSNKSYKLCVCTFKATLFKYLNQVRNSFIVLVTFKFFRFRLGIDARGLQMEPVGDGRSKEAPDVAIGGVITIIAS